MNVKLQAFEYFIFRMAEWYISDLQLKDFREFSEKNNFSREKVLLLPFFACTANGIRQEMFDVFDHFVADDFGHSEKDIAQHLNEFQYVKVSATRLQFTDSFIQSHGTQKTIPKAVRLTLVDDKHKVFENVDYTMDKLKERSKDFALFDAKVLRFYSQRHISWRAYRSIMIQQKLTYTPRINKTILISEASMFAEDAEKRVLV